MNYRNSCLNFHFKESTKVKKECVSVTWNVSPSWPYGEWQFRMLLLCCSTICVVWFQVRDGDSCWVIFFNCFFFLQINCRCACMMTVMILRDCQIDQPMRSVLTTTEANLNYLKNCYLNGNSLKHLFLLVVTPLLALFMYVIIKTILNYRFLWFHWSAC